MKNRKARFLASAILKALKGFAEGDYEAYGLSSYNRDLRWVVGMMLNSKLYEFVGEGGCGDRKLSYGDLEDTEWEYTHYILTLNEAFVANGRTSIVNEALGIDLPTEDEWESAEGEAYIELQNRDELEEAKGCKALAEAYNRFLEAVLAKAGKEAK